MDNETAGPKHPTEAAKATVVFVDLAGFSAIADVFGDAAAIGVLELFEKLVRDSVGDDGKLVKWIGDEAMLLFPEPDLALQALSRLLPACRAEKRIPLTRCGLNHGSVIRRGERCLRLNRQHRVSDHGVRQGRPTGGNRLDRRDRQGERDLGGPARTDSASLYCRRRFPCSCSNWRKPSIPRGSTRYAKCTRHIRRIAGRVALGIGSARRDAKRPTGGRPILYSA